MVSVTEVRPVFTGHPCLDQFRYLMVSRFPLRGKDKRRLFPLCLEFQKALLFLSDVPPLLSFPNKIFGPTFSSCPHILPFIMDHILEMLTLTTKISSTVRIFRSSIMNYFEILVGIKSIKIYPKQCIFPSTSPLAKNVSPFNFALAHSIFPTTLFCKFLISWVSFVYWLYIVSTWNERYWQVLLNTIIL